MKGFGDFMKKKVLIIITIIVVIALVLGIMYAIDMYRIKHNKPVIFSTWGYSYCPPADIVDENPYSFYATIIESKEKYILVEPTQGSQELKSSDKFSIGLDENDTTEYSVGATVKITYDGAIMETYPAKINTIKIEIID